MYTSMYTYCIHTIVCTVYPSFLCATWIFPRVEYLDSTLPYTLNRNWKFELYFLQYFLVAEVRENRNQFVWVELHESKVYRHKTMKAIVSSFKYLSHPKPPVKNVFRSNCSRKYSIWNMYLSVCILLNPIYVITISFFSLSNFR